MMRTHESSNTCGVCSSANAVSWRHTPAGLESRLNDILIDLYAAHENDADDAEREIARLMPAAACSGYWHGRPGLGRVIVPTHGVKT